MSLRTRANGARVLALAIALLALVLPRTSLAAVERYAVLIGNNRGNAGDPELRYAESDASKMYDVLKDLGAFPPENLVLLRGEPELAVRRALISVNDRIRAAVSRPDTEVMLVVYFSGHADADALHLSGTSFEVAQMEALVRSSAATFRVLALDACRSGGLTRVKGATPAAPFDIRLDDHLEGQGVAFLTASSASEDAQESDALGASFFTHYLHSALLGAGDFDQDGRVTLDEAYRYAYEGTIRATTRTLVGTQHPTFRFDLKGRGRLALTEVGGGARRGRLAFPPGRAYVVYRGDKDGPVVAEVLQQAASRRVSVRADRYFVQGRTKDYLLEGSVTVGAGEEKAVSDDSLSRVTYARLVRKGLDPNERASAIEAGYTLRTSLGVSSGACQGAYASYTRAFPSFSVSAGALGCFGSLENDVVHARTRELGADVLLAHAWDLPVLTIVGGAGAGVSVLSQEFDDTGRETPDRHSIAPRIVVAAAVLRELGAFHLALRLNGETHFFARSEAAGPSVGGATFGLRPMAGAGWSF